MGTRASDAGSITTSQYPYAMAATSTFFAALKATGEPSRRMT
jgi:hypothetical protein